VILAGADRRSLGVLSLAHVASDVCQGAVPALLPFLALERGYSYAALAALPLAASLGSSVIQPLFGLWSDRIRAAWLMPAGLLLGGIGLGLAGVVSSYAATALALVASGLGVAAFHPEGWRFAALASGPRRATGMSVFAVGGNAGFALGPILVALFLGVLGLGLSATPLLALVPAVGALLLLLQLPRLERARPVASGTTVRAEGDDRWGPFALVSALAMARTGVALGLLAFVPLYLVRELGTSETVGSIAVSVMLLGGALGTLVGGHLADTVGYRAVVVGAMAALLPLTLVLPFVGPVALIVLLAAVGIAMDGNFSTTVTLAQDFLPQRIGLASGVVVGLSIGVGAIITALLGVLADHAGLTSTLWAIAGLAGSRCCSLCACPCRGEPSTRGRRSMSYDGMPLTSGGS
jgi:MFS transporter, FSR family, fosmidomycin resistance protein